MFVKLVGADVAGDNQEFSMRKKITGSTPHLIEDR